MIEHQLNSILLHAYIKLGCLESTKSSSLAFILLPTFIYTLQHKSKLERKIDVQKKIKTYIY